MFILKKIRLIDLYNDKKLQQLVKLLNNIQIV